MDRNTFIYKRETIVETISGSLTSHVRHSSCKHKCSFMNVFVNSSSIISVLLTLLQTILYHVCQHDAFFTERINISVVVSPANSNSKETLSLIAAMLVLQVLRPPHPLLKSSLVADFSRKRKTQFMFPANNLNRKSLWIL